MNAYNEATRLATKGKSVAKIRKRLERKGVSDQIHPADLRRIVREVAVARELRPHTPRVWPIRCFGLFVVILGLPFAVAGAMRGMLAMVLGAILFLKPGWANDEY